MMKGSDIMHAVERNLAAERQLAESRGAFKLALDDRGALTLEGEVASIAEKRIALRRAAATPGVSGIIDRLHVRPAFHEKDRTIRDHIVGALIGMQTFANIDIRNREFARIVDVRKAADARAGEIIVESVDGVVTLGGVVPSLEHKRLAGVLAWWAPGTRDVVNGLAVEPDEEDGPDKIEEAVRLALELDPFVNAGQIRVGVRDRVVRLTGVTPTAEQRRIAESDAWRVFGVEDVIDNIIVAPF